ncbi:MAG: AraC family transcriptional regulator [Bacillota bacterium]|nr:AraC family transcriptional regulator [Bacillota bacterium]
MKQYLQKAIDYIDEHIEDSINLDEISEYVGFSKFYLNHMFSVYTGLSIMAYVRRKKLEYGLELLKTERRIIDIAVAVGYSSERAFSRAVVNTYGYSPSYFRTNAIVKTRKLNIYDMTLDVDDERVLSGFPSTFDTIKQNIMEKGIKSMKKYLSDVRYEVIESMVVVSGLSVGAEPEEFIIGKMNQLADKYQLNVLRTFGFDSPVDTPDVTTLRGYELWLSVEKADLEKLPNPEKCDFEGTEVTVKTIPGYRYATLRIEDPFSNPFERIGSGWQYLVKWLEDHDFKASDFERCHQANCLEEVKEVGGVTVMDIYIPVDRS